jgi:hypothetical protein
MPILTAGALLLALAYHAGLTALDASAWDLALVARLALALGVWIAAVVYELAHEARVSSLTEQIWVAGTLVLFVAAWTQARVELASPPWLPLAVAAACALAPVVLGVPEPAVEAAPRGGGEARASVRAWRPTVLALAAAWLGTVALASALDRRAPPSAARLAGPPPERAAEVVKAASDGDAEGVSVRVARDPALVRAADEDGATALHAACARGRADIVAALLAHGAPVNARDAGGATPLHHAVQARGDAQGSIIGMLLTRRPDLTARNRHGLTALELAEAMGLGEAADRLRRAR